MKARVNELITIGDGLFTKRLPIMSLWQTMADQFYPERADFTYTRSIGMEFASHLMTGRPALARRDLANSLSSMLRPRGQPWFHPRTQNEAVNKDAQSLQWLDWAGDQMRRLMYDNKSGFVRSTKEGDNDFAAFGQAVLTAEANQDLDGLHYRCHHLKDVCWQENVDLEIDTVHHKWKLQTRWMCQRFPKTVSQKVKDADKTEPFKEWNVRRIIMPADEYDLEYSSKGRKKLKFVSLYVDVDNETVLEEVPYFDSPYIIPRWQTVSGSQYAYSPATVIAISDARMLQQITLTLLEAGQKSVDPPMIAQGEMIQGGINTYAGGVTWVDSEYDEKMGEVLRPINIDRGGFQWANDREQKITEMIKEAFYLNMISLPDTGGDMTAYETQKRVEEYTRRALPLFEPMEVEYNGALCDKTFALALRYNVFGNMADLPAALRGQDIRFNFESPLQQASGRANAQAFQQSAQLLQLAVQIDPTVRRDLDVDQAFRDAITGTGAPSNWLVSKEQASALKQQDAQNAQAQQAAQQAMQTVDHGAQIAGKIGDAAQSLQAGGVV